MGLLSNKIQREQLNPGDHIYTWRLGYSYCHHGICMGDGEVIHLTRAPGLIVFSSSDESFPSHPSGDNFVVCWSMEEFLSGGDLYLYEYGVKSALFLIKRGRNCTRTISGPPECVLERGCVHLEKGFGDYNLFQNNCEDFAIYCKTGLPKEGTSNPGRSGQIQFLFDISLVVLFTPYQFLPSGLALVVYGLLYLGYRLIEGRVIIEKDTRMENTSCHADGCLLAGVGAINANDHKEPAWIYMGDGKVVHLTRAPGLIIFSSSDESSPSRHSGDDRVECCSIEEFLCGGDLYLYEYGVMTALFIINRGGSSTPFPSDPPKDVLHRASILLEKGFGDYNLIGNNCEAFAIYCKTSLLRVDGPNRGISGQIQFLYAIITIVIFSPIGSLPSALALVIHGVLFCSLRLMYNKDGVEKVAVENLDDFSNQSTTRMENPEAKYAYLSNSNCNRILVLDSRGYNSSMD
ncbi:hypothetical protein FNV43_RR25089 [Rhamnella rubrinervis]|uniref:LRAT domain-containing protein n=1 Tax=Rhamnella rubrinervis TaxID=2594499 RepID=A0A8K0DP18_9ROSA|nr:hypothetical protein FNV43_RR25089 [Rhamnella rubrinervis]